MKLPENPYHAMALNNAWANATLWAAVKGLSLDQFTAPRPGFFPSLHATLHHIHQVDLYYVDALERGGKGRSVFFQDEVAGLDALTAAQVAVDNRLITFCKGANAALIAQNRDLERKNGMTSENVGALLLHLFQHQIHHRGQTHVQLQHARIDPPQLDEFYLEFERAPTARDYLS